MFGHNQIAGKKFFAESPEAAAGKLLVTSIFHSIQGEGPFAGQPAVFTRLALCNLSCPWCDTYFDSGDWMDFGRFLGAAAAAGLEAGYAPTDLLVVTGGEPTLQPNLGRFITMTLNDPHSPFARVQIETNGLLPPDVPDKTTVVVSPKCVEVGGKARPYAQLSDATLARADCLKFIVCADPASPYSAVPAWALEWREVTGRPIYVSPMAQYNHAPGATQAIYDARRTPDAAARVAAERVSFWEPNLLDMAVCRANYEHAAAYVLRHDLRLSIQMQLFVSLP